MDDLVFWAVLAAAAMHAGWNAVVKVGLDRFSTILLLSLVQSGLALLLVPIFEPPAWQAVPWLLASGLLHTGYKIFLIRAYDHGDLSQVYPIARGTAPLMVTLISVLALGEQLEAAKVLAVLAIGIGVSMMSLRGGAGLGVLSGKALGYALGTATFTAAYTMVDGIGARAAGSASGFALWLFVVDGLYMVSYAVATRGPESLGRVLTAWRSGLAAGAMSLGSYWIAIWAFTLAPIALVAALRETSVLFAMVIAAMVLREYVGAWRWTAAALICIGILLMRS